MTETRKIFIKSLISGLKIDVDGNPFEYQAVVDGAEYIKEADFMDFYNEARKRNTFGDGVKAIIETAEQFKPADSTSSEVDIKAKELIELVAIMNRQIEKDHARTSIDFNTLLANVNFPTLSKEDEAILSRVKPCYDLKQLIAKNTNGWGSVEQLNAYKQAIQNTHKVELLSSDVKKMIPNMKRK